MKKLDVFAAVNVAIFLVLCVFRYHPRFVAYRGPGHIHEFLVYAAAILIAIGVLWRRFRIHAFDTSLLILLELGILMHFAGSLGLFDGRRLYDVRLAGIRYDKFVHFVNAFIGMVFMRRIFDIRGISRAPLSSLLLVLAVLGLGAVVEVVEYLVVLTVPDNGVGAYDNNMQDLIANLGGSLTWVLVSAAFALRDASPGGGRKRGVVAQSSGMPDGGQRADATTR